MRWTSCSPRWSPIPRAGCGGWIAIVAAAIGIGAIGFAIAARGGAERPCTDSARHLDGVWDPAVAARLDQAFRASGASFASETTATVRTALDRRRESWIAMHREACLDARVRGEQSAQLLDLRMGCLARRRGEMSALIAQLADARDAARVATAVGAVSQLPPIETCADRDALTAVVPEPAAQHDAIEALRTDLANARAVILTGQWNVARTLAEGTQARARTLGWPPLVAEADLLRGHLEHQTGSFKEAEAALTEAAQAAARAHLDDLGSRAWDELAWVVGNDQERPAEGLALVAAAEAIAQRADASPHVLADIAHTRAQIWSNQGDQAAALKEAERALALLAGAPPLDTLDVLTTIALVHTAQADYASAEKVDRELLARSLAGFGRGHPKVADALDNLGVVRFHQGAFAEARRDYEQALALRVAALGPDSRDVGTSHNNLGGLLMDTGDEQGAAEHLAAAVRIYEKALGPDHVDLAIPLSNLGELETRRGDFAQAITTCARALALDERSAPDDPKVAFDLVCVGEAQLGRKHAELARPLLERAVALREKAEGDAGELARARFDLAKALWRGGDRARARTLATVARDGFSEAGTRWQPRVVEVTTWLAHPS